MEKDLKKLIEEYLGQAKLLQVATARENQPWVCNVYFAFDDDLNLYWISKPNRRHSEEIRNNEKVAGTIVLPHAPGDKGRGVQFEGVAKELSNTNQVRLAIELYAKRFGMPSDRVEAIVNNTDGHIPYKITPSRYVLFDELNFPDNPQQEYKV